MRDWCPQDIKEVREVSVEEINGYLGSGWVLVDTYKPNGRDLIFVIGSTTNIPPFKFDSSTPTRFGKEEENPF